MLARKVKLKPNKLQAKQLTDLSIKSKDLYNRLLQENFDRLDCGGRTLTSFDMNKLCADRGMASGMGTDVVQEITKRVDRALKRWQESQSLKLKFWLQYGEDYCKPMKDYLAKAGKKLWGKPRFKTKGISIQFPLRKTDQARVRVFGSQTSVKVPLIGAVKGHNDRQELLGQVKHVTVGKDSCGTWWATIICDGEKPKEEIVSRSPAIGVDLGLKHTITAANEIEVIQPERERFLEKQMKAIQKASRERRRDLPFIHRKIVRRRKHSHHVQAKQLIEAAETVVVGNLKSNFLFSGRLARSASDAAHSQFLSILSYKAANAGKTVKIVNEAYTSQTCYKCSARQQMTLSERKYNCPCGYSNNRDVNAALNILRLGERQRPEA
jgi:putative transposase